MFDVMPYWMWVVSLLVLAVMCGAVLSASEAKPKVARTRRVAHSGRRWVR